MTICTWLIISELKVYLKLFLGQAIFIAKIIVENEAF
jgi:hypothetical protein